jgi:glycosyl hydrolase family 47
VPVRLGRSNLTVRSHVVQVSFGGLGDSYYEYLLKLWLMTGKTEGMALLDSSHPLSTAVVVFVCYYIPILLLPLYGECPCCPRRALSGDVRAEYSRNEGRAGGGHAGEGNGMSLCMLGLHMRQSTQPLPRFLWRRSQEAGE